MLKKVSRVLFGSNPNRQSIFMTPTDPDEIIKLLPTFKFNKSTGDDGISINL